MVVCGVLSLLQPRAGKFYELFEMDAFTGVDVLGLQFMKGDQPHAVRLRHPRVLLHGISRYDI